MLSSIEIKYPIEGVIHLIFPNQDLMASTFLRFQEYYESPVYKGKVFSFEEFKSWYISARGSFSYAADWPGFNIPSHVLQPFYEGRFDPLSESEKEFLDLFRGKKEPFYIIGTAEENGVEYLVHEFAHALYYVYPEFKKESLAIISTIDKTLLRKIISHEQAGYHESVMDEEIIVHLVANFDLLVAEGLEREKYVPVHEKLKDLYDLYFAKAARKSDRLTGSSE